MDNLIKRLRDRADWLESRSFATLSGETEREAADEIDRLQWDSEAAKTNFQLWQEAAARVAELENELHLAGSDIDMAQGPCPGGCHRQTQGARYCLSCFCKNERTLRIAYQDIVYRICNVVDKTLGQHATKGNGVTIETVVPAIESLLAKRADNELRGMVRDALDEKYCTCTDGTCAECQNAESEYRQ